MEINRTLQNDLTITKITRTFSSKFRKNPQSSFVLAQFYRYDHLSPIIEHQSSVVCLHLFTT